MLLQIFSKSVALPLCINSPCFVMPVASCLLAHQRQPLKYFLCCPQLSSCLWFFIRRLSA